MAEKMNLLARHVWLRDHPAPTPEQLWERTAVRLALEGMHPGTAIRNDQAQRVVLLSVHKHAHEIPQQLHSLHSTLLGYSDWQRDHDVSVVIDRFGIPRVIMTAALLHGYWRRIA